MAELIRETWLPLTKGLNQINRSMGKPDLYPFVLGAPVIAKLAFVADLVSGVQTRPHAASVGESRARQSEVRLANTPASGARKSNTVVREG